MPLLVRVNPLGACTASARSGLHRWLYGARLLWAGLHQRPGLTTQDLRRPKAALQMLSTTGAQPSLKLYGHRAIEKTPICAHTPLATPAGQSR